MKELIDIIAGYEAVDWERELSSKETLKEFSTRFYRDVAEIFDAITRIKNVARNPSGFNSNDAAILGLLVRIWKLLKEVVRYYEQDNAQIITLFDRPIVEAAVIASYLMKSDAAVIEDYRKISYKDRLRVLDDEAAGKGYPASPAGKRFVKAVRDKMQAEGFTPDSFEQQKKNRWRLSGKSFRDIFEEIEPPEFYKILYGIGSESIHGSWHESINFDLVENEDHSYQANPFDVPVDVRYVTPIIRIASEPYLLWLRRIDCEDPNLAKVFEWIEKVNRRLYQAIEAVLGDSI